MKTKCGNSLYHICLLPSKILTCLWIRFCMLERNVHLSRKEFFWKRSQNDIRRNQKKEGTAISYWITGHHREYLLSFFTLYVMMMRWCDEMKSLFYAVTSWTSRNNISYSPTILYTLERESIMHVHTKHFPLDLG